MSPAANAEPATMTTIRIISVAKVFELNNVDLLEIHWGFSGEANPEIDRSHKYSPHSAYLLNERAELTW
jgi:hypothetical protein